jgi:sigma-B regulation protein RsbU (phosphoserine phosphatase)
MLVGLFVGLFIGLTAVWFVDLRLRKRLKNAEESQWLLREEKQLVVDFMHRMVEAVGENQDLATLYKSIVHASVRSTGAMAACLYANDGKGSLRGIAVEGLFPPQRAIRAEVETATRTHFIETIIKGENFKIGEGLIGAVAKSGEALLIADAQNDPRVVKHADPALAARSLLIAPIHFGGELLGVLAVANPGDGLSFSETDFSLVESLAEQAGLAINNNQLLSYQLEKNRLDLDMELASSIQGLLLPDIFPAKERLDIATAYRPALKIGGDLYDVFELADNRIGLVVADVSGKGISGSILMASCQTHLRHFALNESSPAATLRILNKALEHVMRTDMFITIIYAIVDLSRERLTIARAGHEIPLVLSWQENGNIQIEQPQCDGMALGMVPPELFDAAISDCELTFKRGDVLVLYTDGVTETVNSQGDEFSLGRLIDTLSENVNLPAKEMITQLMKSLQHFGNEKGQADDITLLVAKCL